MSQKNLCVYGKNGKRLGGGAAQLKRIKDCGGWDAYHKELISRVTEKVYEEVMEEIISNYNSSDDGDYIASGDGKCRCSEWKRNSRNYKEW